jgi:MFS family permease
MLSRKIPNQFALSIFWFAWEVHWAALLGAAMQAQVARFIAPTWVGTATAIFSGAGALFSIVSQYAAGRASDKAGKRIPFIIAGTLLDIAALFGFAFAPSFSTAVFAFVAVQISFNVAGGPYQALIPDNVPRERHGWASGVMALFRLAGNATGLLLAKAFVKQPGPGVTEAALTHGLLLLAGALAVLLLIALAVTVAGVPEVRMRSEAGTAQAQWPERASFVWLVASRSLVSMGLYLILPFFSSFLRFALHVQTYLQTSLTLLLAITACSLAGALPAGLLGDRIPKKTTMFGAFALLAGASLVLANAQSTAPLIPLAVVLGIGWGAYYAVDWALACNLLPDGRAGALMAIWNIGASGPQVLSPLIGGIVADRMGMATGDLGSGYRLLFDFVGAYVVLGAIALAFVREKRAGKVLRPE